MYRFEKDGDIVISGFEQGIAPSPHKGIANIQCANIATETGEVMANFARIQQSQKPIATGAITPDLTNVLIYIGSIPLTAGAAIIVSASTISGLNDTTYYVVNSLLITGTTYNFQISATYGGAIVTGFGNTGTASLVTTNMALPVDGCIENYTFSSVAQQRYYVLDANGRVWVYDTAINTAPSVTGWYLIDTTEITNASGIAVYNGFLLVFANNTINYKETVLLSSNSGTNPSSQWALMTGALNTVVGSPNSHKTFVNYNNFLYYTDGNFIGSLISSSVTTAGNINLWSYGVITSDGGAPFSVLTLTNLIGGNLPTAAAVGATVTISTSGTFADGAANTVYYLTNPGTSTGVTTFQLSTTVAKAQANTPDVQVALISTGTIYYNTFNPNRTATYTLNLQALPLAAFEVAQCLTEVNSQLYIGCNSNRIYVWNESTIGANQAGSLNYAIVPENNITQLIAVSNLVYIFAGQKGNIYITAGSSVSPILTVPDYVTGQIEPYFTWGGIAYIRGRIFFSIMDSNIQTGGVWSFIPTQNYYIQQDTGSSLRLENQNSYGTYAGFAPVLLAAVNQKAQGIQYWAAWTDGTGSNFGIDFSGTVPYSGGQTIIETDLIAVGTMLRKKTFEQIEYKLAAPLASGESIQLYYRFNLKDSWTSCGTALQETISVVDSGGTMPYSGYFVANFQNNQWLQLRAVLTSTITNPSFVRLTEIRVR